MTIQDYTNKANEIKSKFPKTEAKVSTGWGGKIEIEVATVDQAKALKQMNTNYSFKSGLYQC